MPRKGYQKKTDITNFERYWRTLEYLQKNTDEQHPVTLQELQSSQDPNSDTEASGVLGDYGWQDPKALKEAILTMAEVLNNYPDHRCAAFPDAGESMKKERDWLIMFDSYREAYADAEVSQDKEDVKKLLHQKKIKNLYYQHPFSEKDIYNLIEAVRFSGSLGQKESDQLIEKIKEQLATKDYKDFSRISKIPDLPSDRQLIGDNLNTIQDAIEQKKQIRFTFNGYSEKMYLKAYQKGVVISPHFIAAYGGHYYVIGVIVVSNGEYGMTIRRVDLMTEVEILGEAAVPGDGVQGFPEKYDENLQDFLHRHLNMAFDEPKWITLRVIAERCTFLFDAFGEPGELGSGFWIDTPKEGEPLTVHVRCSPYGICNFAMEYCDFVEIVEPDDVRQMVMDKIRRLEEKYGKAICDE